MTEITIADGSDGQVITFTIYRRGTSTAENISGFTAATMAITSVNFETVYASGRTLTISDAANGQVTWTTDPLTDNIPAIPVGQRFIRLKAQVTLTGSSVVDRTEVFDILVENDISL